MRVGQTSKEILADGIGWGLKHEQSKPGWRELEYGSIGFRGGA